MNSEEPERHNATNACYACGIKYPSFTKICLRCGKRLYGKRNRGEPVGNIGGLTDNSIVIMKGPGREFIVPKAHVEAFDGAEVRLDLAYNDLEASYKRIAD